ncbi:MAG: hypothetical protein AAB288_14050, partial [Acidobacteriota bacterium]
MKRIVAAVKGNPHTLFNKLNLSNAEPGIDALEQVVNAGLAIYDNRDVLVPQLAEDVVTVENGLWKVFPDGRMET